MRNTRVIYVLNQGGELSSKNIEFLLVLNEVCSSNSMHAQKEQATSSVLNNRTCKNIGNAKCYSHALVLDRHRSAVVLPQRQIRVVVVFVVLVISLVVINVLFFVVIPNVLVRGLRREVVG